MVYGMQIQVNTGVLRDTAINICHFVQSLKNDFLEMETLLEQTRYYWSGVAADQYRKVFTDQKQEIEEIFRMLDQYPNDLLSITKNYEDSESKNCGIMNVLHSNIIEG